MAILASAPFFLAGFETIPQGVEDAGGDITNVGKTVVMSVVLACIFYAILLICLHSSFGLEGSRRRTPAPPPCSPSSIPALPARFSTG